ncbi:outer membrane protein assembly factor BamA [Fontivita pretiosa]|uniref:outer membrane protein assembly factor BamA n=1 Tax=Fontivita pretiosa TaxID=2989684 RepID=UPI003D16D151
MSLGGLRLRRICCVVLLVLGQVAPLPRQLCAQTRPSPPPADRFDLTGRTVEDVRVLGNKSVSSAVILNLVRTRPGDRFDPQTVQEDYQRIYGLKKFSNVEAKVEPTDSGGVIVVFLVTEQKQIRSIAYRGNLRLDTETIKDVVDVREGEAIDRFRLAIAKQAIENLYRRKNYPFAHVEIDAEALAQRGDVVFNIVEGPNVRIRNINFVGARSFTESRLKSQIQSKTWIFIFRHGEYDPETVEDDVAALRRYYEQKGFFDARVGRKLIWSADMSELQIDFLIEEGVRYTVDRVTFKGNASVSEAELRKNLKLVEGMPYDNELLQRDIRQIVKAYSPFGFIYQQPGQPQDPDYLRIEPRTVFRRQAGRVELVYDISEGKPFRLGRIIPRGNAKTQDKVILREMRMAPGQMYNSAEVQDAVDRLRGTPFFTRVNATPIGDDPNYRDLLVEVEEGKTASFNIGAGINSNGGVGGNITYEQKNFDISNWPSSWRDIFSERAWVGAGQTFRASLEPGTKNTNAYIRFTEPWIFDQPYSFTGELYLRNRIRENYQDQRIGGRVSLGKRFDNIYSAALTLRGETVDIGSIRDKEIRAQEILDLEGNSALSSLGLRAVRDTTNRGLLPSRGMTTSAGIEFFGALGGDFDFQKLSLSHDQYFTLHEDLLDRKIILALHADAGYIIGDAPFFERLYGGGIGSVRGFAFRGISPRSGPDDDRIGGDFSATASAEISFPLAGEELRGVVFTDVGTVEPSVRIGTIRSSVGAGIRLTLPFFGQVPIALDFAVPITKDDEDDTQFFSFSLGFSP